MNENLNNKDQEQFLESNASGRRELTVALRDAVQKVVVGQDETVESLLLALLTGGHVLLEGKPGLGKTHMVLALARAIGGTFGRIQFTPDLMPSDVTGFTLFDMKSQTFQTRRGPVFANLLLADEINRAPAKTQAALLEVMQEKQVTIDGTSHPLEPPFVCVATQNPIEQEGTYPLPEAQLDRFIMKVVIDYPEAFQEAQVIEQVTNGTGNGMLSPDQVKAVCGPAEVVALQEEVSAVQAVPEIIDYAVRLTRATREARGISLGAGTRGAIALVRLAKAHAFLQGRGFVIPDDVKRVAIPVFQHRVQLAPEVLIGGEKVENLLASLIETVEAPRS